LSRIIVYHGTGLGTFTRRPGVFVLTQQNEKLLESERIDKTGVLANATKNGRD